MKKTLLFIATMMTFGLFLSNTVIAQTFEEAGLASKARLIQEAHKPTLLAQFNLVGGSVEGFLKPGQYRFAVGLTEVEILTVRRGSQLLDVSEIDDEQE